MRICIILEANFGADLERLDKSAPIWIVQSCSNDAVVEDLWRSKTGNITSFRNESFDQLIDTVDQHHPGWTELDVYGLCAADGEAPLAAYGPGTFTPRGYGFLFLRQKPK